MGISAPETYLGYGATDNVMSEDATTYGISGSTYTLFKTIDQIEQIASGSTFGIRAQLRLTGNDAGKYVRVQARYFDGKNETILVTLQHLSTNVFTWYVDTSPNTVTFNRGGKLRFYGSENSGFAGECRYIQLRGERVPFV